MFDYDDDGGTEFQRGQDIEVDRWMIDVKPETDYERARRIREDMAFIRSHRF